MAGERDPLEIELSSRMMTAPREMLSREEYDLLAILPDDTRLAAMRRLAVMQAWRDRAFRPMFVDVRDAAARAGMSRSAFYEMLSRTVQPNLAGLGLGIGRLDDERAVFGRIAVVEAAASMLADGPDVATSVLLRRLSAGPGAGMSKTTLLRMIDEARSRSRPLAPFAKTFDFDAVSLDLVDGSGVRQRLYSAIDRGTGFVLGWTIAPDEAFEQGYEAVASQILDPERRSFAWGDVAELESSSDPLEVEMAFGRAGGSSLERRAVSAGWRTAPDWRRTGRRLGALFGPRLGGIRISAGFAPPDVYHRSGVRASLPVIDEVQAGRIDAALRMHNDERLAVAPKGGGSTAWSRVLRTMGTVLGYED